MNNQVFISYHKDDREAVCKLHNELKKRGIQTWMDMQDIKPGHSKSKTIIQGIVSSTHFLACLSPSFLQSEEARNQTFLARANYKKVIPLVVSDFPPKQSPLDEVYKAGQLHDYAFKGLEEVQWIDLREGYEHLTYEAGFESLVDAIQPIAKPVPLNSEGIYITYKRTDKEFARRLAKDLELSRGLVLIDEFFIKAGDNWRERIYENLRSAHHFIVCVSPEATKSENVMHEVFLAKTRELPFYPVVSERVFENPELNSILEKSVDESPRMQFLNDYQWFTPSPDYQTLLKNLREALGLAENEKPLKNGIFISYRRADTQAATGRIREKLVERFGAETVFMDVDSIPPGEDFSTYYREWLTNRAAVVLIMIGEKWTSLKHDPNQDELPRLFSPGDHVRIEAETALGMGDLRVIPVLVGDTSMPRQKDLPESLHGLTRLNACKVRYDPDFNSDMKNLIASIENLKEAQG